MLPWAPGPLLPEHLPRARPGSVPFGQLSMRSGTPGAAELAWCGFSGSAAGALPLEEPVR